MQERYSLHPLRRKTGHMTATTADLGEGVPLSGRIFSTRAWGTMHWTTESVCSLMRQKTLTEGEVARQTGRQNPVGRGHRGSSDLSWDADIADQISLGAD